MQMNNLPTCSTCIHMTTFVKRADEPTNHGCNHQTWGGAYVHADQCCCIGRRPDGTQVALGYSSRIRRVAEEEEAPNLPSDVGIDT